MAKLLLPQEIETFYVIPTLRKYLARHMKGRGMKQKEIASVFGINTAAISQYTNNKRGGKIVFSDDVASQVKISAARIHNKYTYLQEMQRLLSFIRDSKALCQIHHLFSDLPKNCEPKLVGCHSVGGYA